MTQKLTDIELASFRELRMASSIRVDALAQLMIKKGFITKDEFFEMLKEVQAKYKANPMIKRVATVMTMQSAYLSNALLCLIGYFGDWQIGAYCVAITSGVYLTQIVLMSVKLGVFRGGTSRLAV